MTPIKTKAGDIIVATIIAFCLFGCGKAKCPPEKAATILHDTVTVSSKEGMIIAYHRGMIKGANRVTEMENRGNFDLQKLKLQIFKDSIDFANFINK